MSEHNKLKPTLGLFAGLALALTATLPAHAAPLNLVQAYPDLEVTGLPINFDASTGTFTANQQYSLLEVFTSTGGLETLSGSYNYSLTAQLGTDGSFQNGSFQISDGSGTSAATVLNAQLTNFGSTAASGADVFEFTANRVTGTLASQYLGSPSSLGIIMNTVGYPSTFTGSFNSNFTATTLADQFPDTSYHVQVVPVPAAGWLFATGLIGLVAVSRRGHHGSASRSRADNPAN